MGADMGAGYGWLDMGARHPYIHGVVYVLCSRGFSGFPSRRTRDHRQPKCTVGTNIAPMAFQWDDLYDDTNPANTIWSLPAATNRVSFSGLTRS